VLDAATTQRRWARLPHRDVIWSSSTLFGSTAITSLLGFVYWSVVARSAPVAAVGAASALVSSLTLIGTVGMFGFGTMLIAELARAPQRAKDLLPASLAAAGGLAFVLAVVVVAVSRAVSPALRAALTSPMACSLFVIGVVLTAMTFVFDQASVGLSAPQLQLWRTSWFSIGKLLLIPVIVMFGRDSTAILFTWTAGLALSALLVMPSMRKRNLPILRRPRFSALAGLGWVTFHHNLLNLSLSIPRMAVPAIVGVFQPGEATAAFYAAWMIAGFLYAVPTHLSTCLFAIAAGDIRSLHQKIRMTLGGSLGIGVVVIPAVALFASSIMLIFGPDYARLGSTCLILLALQYVPQVVKQHYTAVLRVQGRVRRAGAVSSVAAIFELAAAGVGAAMSSLAVTAAAQGAVLTVEMLLMAPAVVKVSRRSRASLS